MGMEWEWLFKLSKNWKRQGYDLASAQHLAALQHIMSLQVTQKG